MKKFLFNTILLAAICISMNSCYTYNFTVGNGSQTGAKEKEMNNYFIYGLVTGTVDTPEQVAGGATDYDVTIKHRFVDGLLAAITFGIFTPTTTIITK